MYKRQVTVYYILYNSFGIYRRNDRINNLWPDYFSHGINGTVSYTHLTSGKALYVGLSNYDGETMAKASAILDDLNVPFIINQNSYSILNRTIEYNGLKDKSAELGKGIVEMCIRDRSAPRLLRLLLTSYRR